MTSKSLRWIGAAVVLATAWGAMKRKGVIRGAIDTGLNATPFVGPLKGVAERVRGREFFPDRVATARR